MHYEYLPSFVNSYVVWLLLSTGRQHAIKLKCCEHEPEAITIIRNGFWPSTPTQPHVAFDIQFMTLLQYIFLEYRVSLKSIHQALLWLAPSCSKVYVSTYLSYILFVCYHLLYFCFVMKSENFIYWWYDCFADRK